MTSLTKRGYGIRKSRLAPADLEETMEELVVSAEVAPGFGNDPKSFPCYRENTQKIYVPRNWGFEHFGPPETIDPTIESPAPIQVDFQGALREAQEIVVEKYLTAAADPLQRGGQLCMHPGFGKTVCALAIVARLAVKTVVVVHQNFLVEQWEERIRQYLPGARVGRIQGKKVDIQEKDIVMCMLQSASRIDYGKETWADFGLVIVDECHHIGCEVFSRALFRLQCKYTMGLSATPKRKDGLSKVITWHLGEVLYRGKAHKDTGNALCVVYEDEHADPAYHRVPMLYNGKPNLSKHTTMISEYAPRTEFIVQLLLKVKSEEPDRCVLVLSDRRAHLKAMHALLTKAKSPHVREVGYYVGGMKRPELEHVEKHADILLASYQLCSEGFDCPRLNTMVLATSKSDVVQVVGRILRQKANERQYQPLIVDIVDEISVYEYQAKKRATYYRKLGFETHPTSSSVVLGKKTVLE